MDLTQGTAKEKNRRAKKMMLWFGIVSLIMGFAGWTSAYIVSSKREDWVSDLDLPSAFYISTAIIVLSSITYLLAKKAVAKDNQKMGTLFLVVTFVLGIAFISLQFVGFSQMLENGYYFTGPTSNIKMSYVFLLAAVHIAHVVAGLISLSVVLVQQLRNKYTPENMLGLELGATFWHFLDFIWVYLILFMYFVK
ncbi:cytochrome c oxidase subunit 3 [Allomuricauda sp. ARW1Y1]|jgi:cytochrome c oxidase subunit 3|uniref:cytochrome c oxidase subunit 3 n=1 Tax=Flavobacteriaceae TaxID=49546 RepID=UPI0015CE10FB|nr:MULTISPECIES: heme-copper oxidase subunit III [unclassified Allomuricauda]MBO6589878.1 heme-copper oxidase subunit III [Allomuricauda sp.]MBO6619504.1 heme-copper oxidase subunit III [Allomuricauda sp.]MBO6645527.1 heme-copper oxidase subunit III [Allomuricauda sp.]MBO6747734.1 heme-copper oxidase subunit III [Allomuricauda sp.]MBO6829290.1 heme-copper oxidase subunit III [Allomuricauda sp.]